MTIPGTAPAVPKLEGFRERAIREAQRYGADPWIFVRELLQNARDAGATQVQFLYKESDQLTQLHCIDNGEGMGFEHAKTYLFSLYTSSKEGAKDKAGRFGVGFWSILRFAPNAILIRSKPRGANVAQGWGLALDGLLRRAKPIAPAKTSGTEIVLSRPHRHGDQAQRLLKAVRYHGRFLTQRDEPERPLDILVNGVRINEPFALPEPSIAFSGKGIRGVIALAPRGQVELYSRGLSIRSAATLDDLVSSKPQASSLPDGLNVAPQILLDCDNIQVLLHRSDVRENAELTRALALTRRHLRRLVEAQLSGVRPPGLWEIAVATRHWFSDRSRPFYWSCALTGVLALALGVASLRQRASLGLQTLPQSMSLGTMRMRYQGPTVHQLQGGKPAPIDFSYTPTSLDLHFRQFSISDLDTLRPEPEPKLTRFRGVSCKKRSDCVEVRMTLKGNESLEIGSIRALNLPEASGYRIDPASIFISSQGRKQRIKSSLFQDQHGDPWLSSRDELTGQLRYKMGKSSAPMDELASAPVNDPDFVRWKANTPLTRPTRKRGAKGWKEAQTLVAHKVRYSVEAKTARAHQRASARNFSVFARGLRIGAGDCDVQNSILAALLRAQGYQARLALGHVGSDGALHPIAHAWTEFRKSKRSPWLVADASTVQVPERPTLAAQGPKGTQAQVAPKLESQAKAKAPPSKRLGWIWVSGGLCLIALGVVFYRRQKAPIGSVDKSHQRLSQILLGALEQPGSFRGIPGIFRRRVVSRILKSSISLREIQKAHRFGRLWSASHPHAIARRGVACGDEILDTRCPIASALAKHLQLKDLDRWQMLWESRLRAPSALDAINRHFEYLGISLGLVVCSALGAKPERLHLGTHPLAPDLTLGTTLEVPARCLVFYPPQHPLICALLKSHDPAWARFCLVQDALSRVAMEPAVHAQILGAFASVHTEERVA